MRVGDDPRRRTLPRERQKSAERRSETEQESRMDFGDVKEEKSPELWGGRLHSRLEVFHSPAVSVHSWRHGI